MRMIGMVAAGIVALVLGAVQIAATLGVRSLAAPGAWVLAVPPAASRAASELAGSPLPLPLPLRLLLARTALDDGDEAALERAVALLPPGVERAELEGRMLERRGDLAGAARAYLSAGDAGEVERRIDALIAANQPQPAVALARAAVVRLQSERGDPSQLADAWWKLGIAEQNAVYALDRNDAPARQAAMRRALDDYLRALAGGPLIERYLLSAGAEEQNLGRLSEAHDYYARAQSNDPASPDPYASLGEIALLRGDRAGAEALLRKARSLDPASEAAARLARKISLAN